MISEWMRERRLLGCQQHSWYVACVTQSTRYSQLHITMLCHSLPKKKEHVRHHQVLCAAVRFAYTRTASNSKRYLPESSKRIKENILAYIYIYHRNSHPFARSQYKIQFGLLWYFCYIFSFFFFSCLSHILYLNLLVLQSIVFRYQEKKEKERLEYTIHVWEKDILTKIGVSVKHETRESPRNIIVREKSTNAKKMEQNTHTHTN